MGMLASPYSLEYRNSLGVAVAGTGNITGGGSIVLVGPAAAVPEPTTLGLIAGVAGMTFLRRRCTQGEGQVVTAGTFRDVPPSLSKL